MGKMLSDPKLVDALAATAQTGTVTLKSPGGALEMSIATAGGQLAYRVDFRGKPVIQWSNLGLVMETSPALGPAVRIDSSQPSSHGETWTPIAGKASSIRNRYNAVSVGTVETAANGRRLVVEARAWTECRGAAEGFGSRKAPRERSDGLEVEAGAGAVDAVTGLFIQLGPDDYAIVGRSMGVYFETATDPTQSVGLAVVEEGQSVDGRWVPGRRLNGDETPEWKALSFGGDRYTIQRVKLYRYR
jgi:Domain of unknown function (DUF5597)/Glycosyl-hydrolase 97 N-terminal